MIYSRDGLSSSLKKSAANRAKEVLGILGESPLNAMKIGCMLAFEESTLSKALKTKMKQLRLQEQHHESTVRHPRILRKHSRESKIRKDYWQSDWGVMLRNLMADRQRRIFDPTTKEAKLFRRRFRVPFPLFVDILVKVNEHNMFECKEADAFGRRGVPVELKLLGVLRMLKLSSIV